MRNSLLKFLLFFTGILFTISVQSQTTLSSVGPFLNNNGTGAATFNVQNTNATAIVLTELRGITSTSGSIPVEVWYKPTAVSSAPGIISVATGWTRIDSTNIIGVANSSTIVTQQYFSNLNFVVPGNTTYGMAVFATGQRYFTIPATPPQLIFSSGGVSFIHGTNISFGGGQPNVSATTTASRGYLGSISFVNAVNCSGAPTGTITTASTTTPCYASPTQIGVSGLPSATIGYTYQLQSATSASGPFTNVGSSQNSATFTISPTTNLFYRIQISCGASTSTSTPVQLVVSPYLMAGTYTINAGAPATSTNFQNFTTAANAMSCGISGPVVFNVVPNSGPYNDQPVFGAIANTSSINTITINGNGNILTYASSNSNERAGIKLNGTKFLRLNNLRVFATGSYQYALQLLNDADNNIIDSCSFTVDSNVGSTNYIPVSIGGTATSATIAGPSCDSNTLTNCTLQGGYYGLVAYGASGAPLIANIFSNNNIRNQYQYSIYCNYVNDFIIENNDISRPTRTNLTTISFYGIYLTNSSNRNQIIRNKLHDAYTASPASTGASYPIYLASASGTNAANGNLIANNLIYRILSDGIIYGIYNSSSLYNRYYHNTIVLDDPTSTAGGTMQTRGIFISSTATGVEVKNNVISITRNGSSVKHNLYSTVNTYTASNNAYYNTGTGSTDGIAFVLSTSYPTLAAYQSATSKDAGSTDANPGFANPATDNYIPTGVSLENSGAPTNVLVDINNNTRSATTPDMGAFEFTLNPCVTPPTTGIITVSDTVVCGGTLLNFNLNGNSIGLTQTYTYQYSPTSGGTYTDLFPAQALSNQLQSLTTTGYYRAKVVCGTGTAFSNPVFIRVNYPLAGGTYTINAALTTNIGANVFQSFTDAANSMACGITGPVVINVTPNSGPYVEQPVFGAIPNTSATTTITINGNGNTLSFSSSNSNERAGIKLNGTKFLRLNNLTIIGTGTYQYPIQLINDADNNIINGCSLIVDSNTTSQNHIPLSLGGIASSALSTGISCDTNTFTNCILQGGYYGYVIMGNSGAAVSAANVFSNNVIKNSYSYSIYTNYINDCIFEANDISRPTRTSLTTFTGIYIQNSANRNQIIRNRIHDPNAALLNTTAAAYGIFFNSGSASSLANANIIANNILYNNISNGLYYGIYNSSSSYNLYYHNTIVVDDQNATTSSATRGIFISSTATGVEVKNNIVSINRTGTGAKHALFSTVTTYAAANNNYYVNVSNATDGIANYNNINYTTLAAYQTATSKDANSLNVNTGFANPTAGNFMPTSPALDNAGTPTQILMDVNNLPRSATTPDIGAVEFTIPPCSNPLPGITTASASAVCSGTMVNFNLLGNSIALGQSFTFQYSPTINGTYSNISTALTVSTYGQSVTSSGYYRAKVSCGTVDSFSTPVFVFVGGSMAGTYTIDPASAISATNFQNFGSVVSALSCGITGQVTINVAPNSGPYNEQVILPQITGASAANRIIFNGADNTIIYNSTNSNERAGIKLNGADFITVKRINVVATGTYGYGIQLLNDADNNVIDSCSVTVDSLSTSSFYTGISISGSATSSTTVGSNCDGNTFSNNTIQGGYYGITLLGSSTLAASNNVFSNNIIKNFYSYGFYGSYINDATIEANDVSRATRVGASSFYGIYISNTANRNKVIRNRLHDPFGAEPISSNSAYAIYTSSANAASANDANVIANNIIYDMKTDGQLIGVYSSSSSHSVFYYNTIVLNDISSSSANLARVFFQSGTANGIIIKNNVMTLTRGGSGQKNVLYLGTSSNVYVSDNNDLFTTATGPSDGVAVFNNSIWPTLAQYQAASTLDSNSVSVNPGFANPSTGDFTPTVTALNNSGTPVSVLVDVNNSVRSLTTPDMGAYEFTIPACNTAPTAGITTASDTSICSGTIVNFNLNGNSIGLTQTYTYQYAPTIGGTYTDVSAALNIPSYTIAVTATGYYRAKVSCSGNDAFSTPKLVTVNAPLAGGIYTINAGASPSSSNFASFSTAAFAMRCGITGPIVLNVVPNSGPYVEQVEFVNVSGTSVTNTITINGNNNILTFNSNNSNDRAGIRLNGTDYVSINNLTVNPTGNYGFGIQLLNDADNNNISGCTINMDSTSLSSNYAGIVISSSISSPTSSGSNCDSTKLINNIINGGYYGITMMGSTYPVIVGNIIAGNTISNSAAMAIYMYGTSQTLVDSNNISRATRTTGTTYYGIYATTGTQSTRFSNNRVHNVNDAYTSSTNQITGLYVAGSATSGNENVIVNNLVYNFYGAGAQYGLYNPSGSYNSWLHNTVSLDDITSTVSSGYTTRGFYQTSTSNNIDVKNNIFSLRRSGASAKTVLYFNTPTSVIASNYNDLYLTPGSGSVNDIGYNNAVGYNSLASWTLGTSQDANSVSVDPQYFSTANGILAPVNVAMDNLGTPLGVLKDISGVVRSTTTPDMGAYEFPIPTCLPPSGLVASNIAATTATISWTPFSGGVGYEYIVSTSPTVPTGAGTPTTSNSANISSLTGGTPYYFFVRSYCGGTEYSAYALGYFTTCAPPMSTLTAAGPTAFCQGGSVVLNANTGSGFTYQYILDSLVIAGAAGPSYTATAPGLYRVRISNSNGCFDTSSALAITVNPKPIATLTPASTTTICQGGSVVLNANTGAGLSYIYILDSNTIFGISSPSYTATAGGSYRVRVLNGNGCIDTSSAVTVTVNPLPLATLNPAGATTICQGGIVVLNANTGSGFTYQYLLDSVIITSASGPSYAATATGSYRVRVANANGCVATSAAVAVTVNPRPNATLTAASTTNVCQGGSVLLNATTGAGFGYQYLLNNSIIIGASSSSYLANVGGTYRTIVTNSAGCKDTSLPIVVTISPAPVATLTPAGSSAICQGSSVVLNANFVAGFTYKYLLNNTLIAGATNSSYTASSAGSYRVIVTNTAGGGCFDTSGAVVITVNARPSAALTAASATTFCQGGSVLLNANTGSGLTYKYVLDSFVISAATGTSYNATASGAYRVIVSNAAGCKDTSAAVSVTVNPRPTATLTPASATTFCQGGSVLLNANTGSGLTYKYVLDSFVISAATGTSYNAIASGAYRVIVSSAAGCKDTSAAINVTVNPKPTATLTAASATTFCQGGSVLLNANTGSGFTYKYVLDSFVISAATGTSYNATASGTYRVIVSSAAGCKDTSTAVSVTVNPRPTATLTPASATTFCQGGSVLLNANTGSGLTYKYVLDSFVISAATGTSYNATATGAYRVIVSNAAGCKDTSAPVSVTVNPRPTATLTPASATTFCQGGSVLLNANTGSGFTYKYVLDSFVISAASGTSYNASAPGAYRVIVSSAAGCKDTSAVINVIVNPRPTATLIAATTTTFCQGGSVLLNANTGSGLTYKYVLDSFVISAATGTSYNAAVSGAYRVIVSNAAGCKDTSAAINVTVYPKPIATLIPTSATTFCQGRNVVLNATAGTGLNYEYLLGNTILIGASGPSYTANATGLYRVIVSNANGCFDTSAVVSITVNPIPTLSVSPSPIAAYCANDSVALTASSNASSFQWRLSGNSIAGATGMVYYAKLPGSYSVIVNSTGCSATSTIVTVRENPLPVPVIYINTDLLSTGYFTTYQWYVNGNLLVGATAQSIQAFTNGAYEVEVTDANGCKGRSAVAMLNNVSVNPTSGVSKKVSVYPNPTTGILYINAPQPVDVKVMSLDGKLVMLKNDASSIAMPDVADGLYFIRITSKEGEVLYNGRFMKSSK